MSVVNAFDDPVGLAGAVFGGILDEFFPSAAGDPWRMTLCSYLHRIIVISFAALLLCVTFGSE